MNANANGGLSAKWGGEEGIVYTIDFGVSVTNDKGDHVDVTVSQDRDGNSSAEISVGFGTDEEKK